MAEITREAFSKAIHDAVEERGADWVYPEAAADTDTRRRFAPEWYENNGYCRYRLDDGAPACIIGAALDKIGQLDRIEGHDTEGASRLLRLLGADDVLADAAGAAQYLQDDGRPWGDALDEFDRVLGSAS